ncbi:type VI secretion system baseplate subunit TssK [Roseateles amylovorans]|uniref:Type VI secretion system baseplate subunit TssK n=1 Tax=Roseateles amylovorans TaxID=2978473 RepID=A0ABY6B0R0_9BURK|nr:type VI secretion system baseplate subunit TssK [Roseateles amylovorans]UXH78527.1 type VI secretion system baseplate subunit TssK [Roseateles amylovorans]
MTSFHSVLWSEGQLLQPQHFQQEARHQAHQWRMRLDGLALPTWGWRRRALDPAALLNGQIAVRIAQAVMPDGLWVDVPGEDPVPAPLEVPPDTRDETVWMVLSPCQAGVPETDLETQPRGSQPRFLAWEAELHDANASPPRRATVQLKRPHLRLQLARDVVNGELGLPVCRIRERRGDRRLVLDDDFIAPTLDVLTDGPLSAHLRELQGLLRQRGEVLAQRLTRLGRGGVDEIVDLLLLAAINRAEPLAAQWSEAPTLHPREFYLDALRLAGDLATFRETRRPLPLPAYHHDDPRRSFDPLMDELRTSLSIALEQTAFSIPLVAQSHGILVAALDDPSLLTQARFVLAAWSELPPERLRRWFPDQVKVAPRVALPDLMRLQLPGLPLTPVPVVPRQIPYREGADYFEISVRDQPLSARWDEAAQLAIHVAGSFPALDLTLWVLKP